MFRRDFACAIKSSWEGRAQAAPVKNAIHECLHFCNSVAKKRKNIFGIYEHSLLQFNCSIVAQSLTVSFVYIFKYFY